MLWTFRGLRVLGVFILHTLKRRGKERESSKRGLGGFHTKTGEEEEPGGLEDTCMRCGPAPNLKATTHNFSDLISRTQATLHCYDTNEELCDK